MPIAVRCTCGANLEFDDKFAGQTIPCPDCNKPLSIQSLFQEPRHTSGLALTSLMLALIGAFTLVGTLAAMVLGYLAQKQIQRQPQQLAGLGYARAGMILGACFTLISTWLYLSSNIFGIDAFFRDLEWAPRLDYTENLLVDAKDTKRFSLKRAHPAWGIYRHLANTGDPAAISDDLILVNARQDGYFAVMSFEARDKLTPEERIDLALSRFRNSELVALLARGRKSAGKMDIKPAVGKEINTPERESQELTFPLTLGGRAYSFLMILIGKPSLVKVNVLVGVARPGRFPAVEEDLRAMIQSFQME